MHEFGESKRAIFEAEKMEERKRIEQGQAALDAAMNEWREKKVSTAECMHELQGMIEDAEAHPVLKLSAYERLAQLFERREPENRAVLESMIEYALTEPHEEMQNAELGILGSRLDHDLLFQRENRADAPRPLLLQAANATDALINGVRVDERLPKEYRDFASLMAALPEKKKADPLWERMEYMAKLYRGDAENLWPALGEFAPEEGGGGGIEVLPMIEMQKGRRRLPEGHVPSPQKELQAETRPRAGGKPEDIGKVIPLRVFVSYEKDERPYDIGSFSGEHARTYLREMRAISMSRKFKDKDSRDRTRREKMDEWRGKFWERLPEKDKERFGAPEDLTLRIETLFNEDALKKLLEKELGSADLAAADPDGYLAKEIDQIIGGDGTEEEKLASIGQFVGFWKEMKKKPGAEEASEKKKTG